MDSSLLDKYGFEFWELLAVPLYVFVILVIAIMVRNRYRKTRPEYRFLIPGLLAKMLGGVLFGLIYFFYYKGGDTLAYYESGVSIVNLLFKNLGDGLTVLVSSYTPEIRYLFDSSTGHTLTYIHADTNTYTVVRLIVPLLILGMKSYFITTLLLAACSYPGLWRAYLVLSKKYPGLSTELAIAFLFIPSVVFWGSGILKDTFTLSASAWFFSSIYYAFFEKRRWMLNIIFLLIASYILLAIKPYIFLMILPGSLIWISYDRITRIRNRVLAVLAVPGLLLLTFGIGLQVIILLNDSLGDYSPDKIIDKAIVTQSDLKREYYGDNSFDIGDIDPSFIGFVSKFPPATLAGLFRPFIWESNNVVMLFSGLENLILLILFILALFRSRLVGLPGRLFRDPMLLFCFAFSVFFAYAIGLTTANFGALVRFKIPLIPFFAASVVILMRSNRRKAALPQRTFHTLDEEWLQQAQQSLGVAAPHSSAGNNPQN